MAAFLLIWVNGAVGIIGDSGNYANLMYFGVLAIAAIAVLIARFRAPGMARTMFVTAAALVVVAGVSLVGRLGAQSSGPLEILILNGFLSPCLSSRAGSFCVPHERNKTEARVRFPSCML